jgi:hypothetical protein
VRRAVPVLLSAILVTLAGWLLAPPASACSCAPATTQEQFERADAVFTASLRSREVDSGPAVYSSDDPALHVFLAHVVFKGEVHEAQAVVSAADSAACGIAVPDDEPVVVFATRSPDLPEGRYAASLCGGTGPADPAVIGELAELTTLTTSTGAPGGLPLQGSAGTETADPSPLLLGLGAAAVLAVGVAGGLLLRRRSRSRRGSAAP